MSDFVIETQDITKRFGDNVAVDQLNLRVNRGEVYGFLGPNGAGKTTTLRLLLGLVRPTSGSASILGAQPGSSRNLPGVGALVEGPGLYPFLSGRDNLRVIAKHAGSPVARIDSALHEVGLADRAEDRFKTYSQGMKQRLGLAAALLKDPEVLILDEPTNGLDPKGMAEMRAFIRGLGRGRRTVLLSSHLMSEVEQICDRVGVISHGVLVREGTVDGLRGDDGLLVRARPVAEAGRVLERLSEVAGLTLEGDAFRVRGDPSAAAEINRALVGAGVAVSELRRERPSLEEVFLELTQDEKEESS
jgi:ABC-type multidrug transport system ATPase subunit